MGETYLCIILVLADYKGLERSVYRSNPLAGLLILENKYSRLAFQIVVRVLSGRVHHINIDFSPGLFECGYGILLCPPPLHAQTKWNYGQSTSLQLVLGFDYQIHGFIHCIIFPGKKNVFCLNILIC